MISAAAFRWKDDLRLISISADRLVFISYNILGVENASKHPELYRKVLPKYLRWDYRKQLLRKEIKAYGPGIMCFQANYFC